MADGVCSGEHFLEKYQADLIKRVSKIEPILDEFLHENIIKQNSYDEIHSLPTSQKKMTALFRGPLQYNQGKAMFYKLLNKHEPDLIDELRRTEVATMAVKETLNVLSSEDIRKFKWLLQFPLLQLGLSQIPWVHLDMADRADLLVDVMLQKLGQQYVEVIKEVLMDMNRTDLVQRLPETSSGLKEKYSVDEPWSALIQKQVETIESDIQLLLETLAGLSDGELEKFEDVLLREIDFRTCPSDYLLMTFEVLDKQNIVLSIVLIYSQQSVNKSMEVLKKMNRTDLVQMLSRSSSRHKKKLSDEHRSALIQKAATKSAVKLQILETMKEFDNSELGKFDEFLQLIVSQKNLPDISWMLRRTEDRAGKVDLMMQTYGYQSLYLTRKVVSRMKRADQMHRFSLLHSGFKASPLGLSKGLFPSKEPCVDEQQPALSESEATMTSVQENLLETLEDLNDEDLEKFKHLLQYSKIKKGLSKIPRRRLETTDRVGIVKMMMETYDQQSVEVTKEVLKMMDRRDLVERLSETSLGLTEKRLSEPTKNEATMMKELLETLEGLSCRELEQYKLLLPLTRMKKGLPRISRPNLATAGRVGIVKMMMKTYEQQSVEVTMEVLKKMDRRDLVERLSDFSLGSKTSAPPLGLSKGLFPSKEPSVDEQQPALSESEATMTSVKWNLLETLKDLNDEDLEKFKHVLQYTKIMKGLPKIPRPRLETANRVKIVKLMMETYDQQTVEVTKEVLMKMDRRDLVERLSQTSLGLTGPARSLDHEDCGSIMQVSSDWTKLNPEVNSNDADEAPIYSLQSEAGTFECSVSGLRWICKGKVSFKYQFCPFEEHKESIRSQQYMPAGPLMDITVIAGKLDEVHLPHWICIDDNPTILDNFAVLHIDDCGVVVEKVSEVTSSHVKLCEPVFSPRAVLMRVGFSVKINCNVLIYKTNTAFLTLHVYLIPRDPGLQQEIDKTELSYGCKKIRKPNPEKSLKMKDCFILTTDLDGAKIGPKTLKLRYENPNYFQVFIDNPDTNFELKLTKENESQEVWTHPLQKGEYHERALETAGQSSTPSSSDTVRPSPRETGAEGDCSGVHFVDKHRVDLIARVSEVFVIMDELLKEEFMTQEMVAKISATPTNMAKMRMIYSGPLNAAGRRGKDVFYKLLEQYEKHLMEDLKNKK